MLGQELGRSGGRRGLNFRPSVDLDGSDSQELVVLDGRPLLGRVDSIGGSGGLRGRPLFLRTTVHPSRSSDSMDECSDEAGESGSLVGTDMGTGFAGFRGRPRPRSRGVV